jgi:hypothetical protein
MVEYSDPDNEMSFINKNMYTVKGRQLLMKVMESGEFTPGFPSFLIARDLLAVINGNKVLRKEHYDFLTDAQLRDPELKKMATAIVEKYNSLPQ